MLTYAVSPAKGSINPPDVSAVLRDRCRELCCHECHWAAPDEGPDAQPKNAVEWTHRLRGCGWVGGCVRGRAGVCTVGAREMALYCNFGAAQHVVT
jgi:hypothetical protein